MSQNGKSGKDQNPENVGGAARKSRDSSLYKGIYERSKSAGDEKKNVEASLKEAAQTINLLSEELHARDSLGIGGGKLRRKPENNFKFVLTTTDPQVVPIEHQAVIEELTATLDSIDTDRQQLEEQLAGNNSANKLQIAQIKGRLADLRRRKLEIEALLGSRGPAEDTGEQADSKPG